METPVKNFKSPFHRPWSDDSGAAAAASRKTTGIKGIFAGGFTGAIEVTITYPTEFIKTQLQLDEGANKREFDGILDCVRKTYKRRGFLGFYRGLSVLIYGAIPKNGVRFGSFETFKTKLIQADGTLSPSGRFLCGMCAGTIEAIVVVTPMETIKVRFIHDQRRAEPRFKGFFHGVRLIVNEFGFGGIYKGLLPTILRQSSNQGIRFFIVESLKEYYKGEDKEKVVPKYFIALFGALAGAASVYGNTPIDVVKTRMQGLESEQYKGMVDCIMKIWKNEGPLAFYKGTVPRLTRICLDVAITFTVYEIFMDLFNKIWK